MMSRLFFLPKLRCPWPLRAALLGVKKVLEARSMWMYAADFFRVMISFAFCVWGRLRKEKGFLFSCIPDFCSLSLLTDLGLSKFSRLVFDNAYGGEFGVYFSFEMEVFLWNLGIVRAIWNLSTSMLALTSLFCVIRLGERLVSNF